MVEYSDLVQFFGTKLKIPSEVKPHLPDAMWVHRVRQAF